ncbi:periplasmic heavy metal sensor [bacterium]|nr:periplasmic heavy metal sensor [bacterium]
MNWKHITAVVVVILFTVGLASAKPFGPPGQGKGKPGWGHGQMGPGQCDMPGMFGLKLTDEQNKQVQNLKLEHQRAMLVMKSDMSEQHNKLKLAVTDKKFNQGDVDKIAGNLGNAHEKKIQMKVKFLRAMRDILTDDQRVIFDQKILAMGIGLGHGMKKGPGMRGHGGRGKGCR